MSCSVAQYLHGRSDGGKVTDPAGVHRLSTTHRIRGSAGLSTRRAYNTNRTKLESLASKDATE